jgi:hypothetical protein
VRGALLAWAEQGLGDEILYCGMISELSGLAGKLVVSADPRLLPLLRRSFRDIEFMSRADLPDAGGFDAQIPMGSMGRFLRAAWSDFPRARQAGRVTCRPMRSGLRFSGAGCGGIRGRFAVSRGRARIPGWRRSRAFRFPSCCRCLRFVT